MSFWTPPRFLILGIVILHSVVQHIEHLLPGINLCVLFGPRHLVNLEVKEDLDTEKKIEKSR